MKCPRCGLVTFDHLRRCPRCEKPLDLVRPLTGRSGALGPLLLEDVEAQDRLRDRLHDARLSRRKRMANPLSGGSDPDAPEWFAPDPVTTDDTDRRSNGQDEPGLSAGSAAAPEEERASVNPPDSDHDEERSGRVAIEPEPGSSSGSQDPPAEASGELPFDGDSRKIDGFQDWREELRERLKRIRARKEQEKEETGSPRQDPEVAAEAEAEAPSQEAGVTGTTAAETPEEADVEAALQEADVAGEEESEPARREPEVETAGEESASADTDERSLDELLDAAALERAMESRDEPVRVVGGSRQRSTKTRRPEDRPDTGESLDAAAADPPGKGTGDDDARDPGDEQRSEERAAEDPLADADLRPHGFRITGAAEVPFDLPGEEPAEEPDAEKTLDEESEGREAGDERSEAQETCAEEAEPVEARDQEPEPAEPHDEQPEAVEARDQEPEPAEARDQEPEEPVEARDQGPEEPVEARDQEPGAVEALGAAPGAEPPAGETPHAGRFPAGEPPTEGEDSSDEEPADDEIRVAEPPAAESVDAEPVDAESVDAEPVDAEPVDAEPVDAEPVDVEIVDDAPEGDEIVGTATEQDEVPDEEPELELGIGKEGAAAAMDFDVDDAEAGEPAAGPAWDVEEEDEEGTAGAVAPSISPSAGPLGERAAATACDGLVLVAIAVSLVSAAASATERALTTILTSAPIPLALAWAVFAVGYGLFFNATCGQTIGRMVMKLRVVSDDEFSVGLRKAAIRMGASLLSLLPLGLGALPALRDPQRRTLHDRISRTRVVKA